MSKKHGHKEAKGEAARDPKLDPELAAALDVESNESPAVVDPPPAEGLPNAVVEGPDDKFLRLAAEYDNYRKRTAKERAELSARAQGELLTTLIDPLDDLARVIAQGPGAQDAKTVLDAVEVVDKKMMKALVAAGLEILNPIGQPFDPEQHEAVSIAPAASAAEDHPVAQVFQPGYRFKGQLLRAARVVVKQWNG